MIVVCRAGPRAGTKRMGPDATCGNACASPLEASSGRTVRHRLNRGGVRALNRALHSIAVTRMRSCPTAQADVARRAAKGTKVARSIRANQPPPSARYGCRPSDLTHIQQVRSVSTPTVPRHAPTRRMIISTGPEWLPRS